MRPSIFQTLEKAASDAGKRNTMATANLKKAVGIDFGGTETKLARVNERGKAEAAASFPTAEAPGPDAWIAAVAAALPQLGLSNEPETLRREIVGIGIGAPGFTDFERGYIYDLTNVPGWKAVPLADRMEARFGVRTRVDNDVNAMAMGECTFGVGRLYQHAVFVTLGTGVGGGLLIHNRIYRGAHSMAGEIGHVSIDLNGIRSPQGVGGLEQYVGNRAIVERAAAALRAGRASALRERYAGDFSRLTPRDIAAAATAGDALALEVFDFVALCLATAFASIAYLLQPQVIIVGGGVAQAGPVLFDPLRRHLKDRLSPLFYDRMDVRPAALGAAAGVIGCAALALAES